jgi:hypothetical protein
VTGNSAVVRSLAVLTTCAAAVSVTTLIGGVRERNDLPHTAQSFLQASIQAGALTTCLQGARDDLYIDDQPQLHNQVAVSGAMDRLRSCDTAPLVTALNAVHLPPAAALTDAGRRRARADIVTGTAMLRRVVLDARGARLAFERQIQGQRDGTAVVLAYSSASTGSDTAYALADEALALLGHPQSTVG